MREPADRAARSVQLAARVAQRLAGLEIRILDLAAGTGANVRALAEHLPMPQDWLLVDHDAVLLESMQSRMRSWGEGLGLDVVGHDGLTVQGPGFDVRLTTTCRDLMRDTADLHVGRRLVTASALLDLVSAHWLHALAAQCARHRAIVLFPLNYDGRIDCSPADTEDEMIRRLVNTHQRTDKGFGLACGPDAPAIAQETLGQAGYDVAAAPSDWDLWPESGALQRALIDGWADAASEIAPEQKATIDAWRARRLAYVSAGRSRIVVGHVDVAGFME